MATEVTYNKSREWRLGILSGLPIGIGYLAVSFGVGILAVRAGMTPVQAAVLSATNLTSAGQAAGIGIIASAGSYIELALSQFVINLRYLLMGLSLTQKLDPSFRTPQRLLGAHGITDEIFGVASARPRNITPPYLYGMIVVAMAGWTGGTFLGAVAGSLLPARLSAALGILLYGMFVAILIPPAKKSRRVLFVIALAAVLHLLFYYAVPSVSDGFAIIICGLVAAVAGALLFPLEDENEPKEPSPMHKKEGRPE